MAFLDSWEEEINDFVKKYYQSFFSKSNFKFFKKEATQGGGAMTFSDSAVLFEIANNTNRFVIKLGPMEGKLFFGLDIIKAYFKITDYRIDEDDIPSRKKVLLESFHADDYSGNATFLIANFNKIKNLFSPANYGQTKVQMEKLSLEKQKYA